MTATVLIIPRITACPVPAERDRRGETEVRWELIDFCPLYVENHVIRPGAARHYGCIDDVAKPCRVRRGRMDFIKAVERVRKLDPRLVAACEFRLAIARMRGAVVIGEERDQQ